jgi:heterodisulfide reductase subunit A-like polyferredoxin
VAICNLKRYAANQVDLATLSLPQEEPRPEKVAIIGSGPAGLTCAYHLALKGYRPTIFEALPKAGGMLRVGIPDYRLPKDVLDREIDNILRLGVELKTNTALGRDFTLDDLKAQGYQAIFLGLGCHVGKTLKISNEDIPGVIQGVEFLRRQNLGETVPLGKRVAIIGGGNVAIDVACTARRLGSQVTVIYRRSLEEMPAFRHEIEQALCEGVDIIYLALPLKGPSSAGTRSGPCSASGWSWANPTPPAGASLCPFWAPSSKSRWTPSWRPSARKRTSAPSGGQRHQATTPWGTIVVDEITYETSRPGIFAAGDVHTGPWNAIEAVGGASRRPNPSTAISTARLKKGREKGTVALARWREVPRDEEGQPRELLPTLPPEHSCKLFDEIALEYTPVQAHAEAERCLNCSVCSECMQCVEACQAGAVDHAQQAKITNVEVGALILAPGLKLFDALEKPEYGYRRYPNVVTSLDFERMLSATGPFAGHVRRPSDRMEPRRIAWIQCVGSREKANNREFCSYICCMHATKQAIIAQDHSPGLEASIFYIDLRAQGKGFDRYCERAQSQGIRFIRGMVSRVTQDPGTHNLELTYAAEDNRIVSEEFDLVVLSLGLSPHPYAKVLAASCGIATNRWGFAQNLPFDLVATDREGIYTCGVFQGPKDIPETVSQASAAAAASFTLLKEARGTQVTAVTYPPERDTSQAPPKIGVFVCHCGSNIASVIDVEQVADHARTLPNVTYADHYTFTCSAPSLVDMRQVIEQEGLNRVVVAACSPRTHEPLFMENLRQAGLNKHLFWMVNIRDQDSWVHKDNPQMATEKAKELLQMGVARAALLEPLPEHAFQPVPQALVVGGGLAGMTAALTIANAGFGVYLVEKGEVLGGMARRVFTTLEGFDMQAHVSNLVKEIKRHPKINLMLGSRVTEFSGHVGQFTGTVATPDGDQFIEYGAAIIATGGQEYRPEEYLYGQDPRVLTQLELESRLVNEPDSLPLEPRVVMIQCVGCREPDHQYCSRLCCGQAVKNALTLKEIRPRARIFVLYRDMRTYGLKELYYQQARDLGVQFCRYGLEQKPEVGPGEERLQVKVFDQNLKNDLSLQADLVVLSAAVRPHPDSQEVAQVFKLPLDADNFFLEAHLKLRPLDFSADGIFLCGLAHSPKYSDESIAQAKGAAVRALGVLAQEEMQRRAMVAWVDPEKCAVCLTCVRTCPYNVPVIDYQNDTANIDPAKCQGCGVCVSECPGKAIQLKHFTDVQIIAQELGLAAG